MDRSTSFANAGFCISYVLLSAVLINYNKFVMQRFPYAMVVTSGHMICSFVSLICVYQIFPTMFPAIEKLRAMEANRQTLLKYFLPSGLLFGISLFASNQSYLYCTVAFLQFCKEANVVIVFLISCAIGLQKMDRLKLALVLWIVCGSIMCVRGEIHFVVVGLLLQIASQFAECSKNVLGEYIMIKSDLKMDPLSYVLCMAPSALAFLSVGIFATWDRAIPMAIMNNWHILLPNACLAVFLNISIALVIKHCSAMGFILAGVVKDILIVSVAAKIGGDIIMPLQIVGFAVALSGVACWSMIKAIPDSALAAVLKKRIAKENYETLPLASSEEKR